MKWMIVCGLLLVAPTVVADSQEAAKRPPVIRIEFSVNGVSKPCKRPEIRISVAGKEVPVERIESGFVVPRSLLALYDDLETRKVNNVSIHLACGEQFFDLTEDYPVRLQPGLWRLRILYPDAWKRDDLFMHPDLLGFWTKILEVECDGCDPGIDISESVDERPAGVVDQLENEQPKATGERAMEIAFALAVFGEKYKLNRNYLLELWKACLASPDQAAIEGICDDTTLSFMLADLYYRGDETLLPVLLNAAESKSYAAEELGHFYAEMLKNQSEKLLEAMNGLPASTQSAICRDAVPLELYVDTPRRQQVDSNLLASKQPNAASCLKAMREAK